MRVLEAIIVPLLACGAYAAVAAVPVGGGAVIIEHEIAPNLDVPARAHAARAPGDEPPAAEVDCDTANSLSTQSGSAPAPYTSLSAFPTAVDPLPTPYTSLSAFPTMMSTSTTEASVSLFCLEHLKQAYISTDDTIRLRWQSEREQMWQQQMRPTLSEGRLFLSLRLSMRVRQSLLLHLDIPETLAHLVRNTKTMTGLV